MIPPGVAAGVEWIWTLGFAFVGRLFRSAPELWQPAGGAVLVVSPHPDDETLGCGGVLLRHRACKDRVVVVQVTDGGASGAGGLPREEMAARRAREAAVAASRLGSELVLLGLSESSWEEAALVGQLQRWLTTLDPAVVYAPSPVDYHPEHLRVARALATALPRPDRPIVRVWEVGVPLTATLTNLIVDVAAFESHRQAVLAAYRTQRRSIQSLARVRRYNGAFWRIAGEVECFWELTPRQYRAAVEAGDWSGRTSPYRGFRPRPFADPLCYVQGQAERRRLARVAAGTWGTASD